MEIARVIPSFYPQVTGPANQAYRISLELERAGFSSPIYTSNFGAEESPAFEIMDGIKINRFPVHGSFLSYRFTPQIMRELMKTHPNIIHVHGYRNFQATVSYFISKMRHVPFVVSNHGCAVAHEIIIKKAHLKLPYVLYDAVTRKNVLMHANYVVASTKQEFDELVRFGVDKDKIRIIPVGVDLAKYDAIKANRDKSFLRILFVGRITKDRNLGLLLDAFETVAGKNDDARLTIVGGEERRTLTDKLGHLDALKRKVAKLDLAEKVEFTGPLYGTDLIRAYKSADIFVYPSLYENFGQTILEAAAANLPIISTPVGVATDLIADGKNGFTTSFNDPDELAEKMLTLLDNEGLRSKFSQDVRMTVEKEYRWDKIIEKYLAIYDALL